MPLNFHIEKSWSWIVIAVISLLLCVGFLGLGVFPDDYSYLDWSWKLALHYFFLNKKIFGQEVIFPLGPYGFLYSKTYFPGTYFLTSSIWIVLSLVFWWSSFGIAYKMLSQSNKLITAIISLIWFMGLLFSVQGSIPDAFFMSFSIFLLTYYFYVDEKKTSYSSILLTITLAFICLIKFSFTGSSLLVISLITINDFLEKKKPALLVTFLVAFPLFWVLAGQPLLAIPSFIINGLTVAQYYSELAFGGSISEVLLVLFTIFLIILPILINEWGKKKSFWFLPLIGYLTLSQMAFKAGYTRIDEWHVFTTNKILIVIAIIYLLICFYENAKAYTKCLAVVSLLVAIILFGCNLSWYNKTTLPQYLKSSLSTLSSNITFSFSVLVGKTNLQELYDNKMAKIRQENPLTPVTGTVDLYSARQSILFAHNLTYQPRPVFQSNMTTPYRVAKINADFLKSKNAPENIFFNNEEIDNRFPTVEDSLSWPQLLTLYDIKSFIPKNQLLLLQLSKNPRTYSFGSAFTQEIHFNQDIDMSTINNKLVWVNLDIKPTIVGKISSILWRMPIVYLRVTLKNDQQYFYYLPREMAKTGFLLSPVINNSLEFAKLASKQSEIELSQNTVQSFTVIIEDTEVNHWLFQPNISLSFSFLDFPKQDISALLTEIKQEEEKINKNNESNKLVALSLTQIQQGDVLQAIVNCEKAIKIDPNNYTAYNNLGVSYKGLFLFNEAISAFEKALAINPEFSLAKNNLVDAKNRQAQTTDSNQAISGYTSLTLFYISNNMFEKAISSCEEILKISPNYAIAYNNICVAYNGLGLWDKAIIAGEKAVSIDPNFQLAKNNLAWAKSQKEKANASK